MDVGTERELGEEPDILGVDVVKGKPQIVGGTLGEPNI